MKRKETGRWLALTDVFKNAISLELPHSHPHFYRYCHNKFYQSPICRTTQFPDHFPLIFKEMGKHCKFWFLVWELISKSSCWDCHSVARILFFSLFSSKSRHLQLIQNDNINLIWSSTYTFKPKYFLSFHISHYKNIIVS